MAIGFEFYFLVAGMAYLVYVVKRTGVPSSNQEVLYAKLKNWASTSTG
jgi:hypothetical protein